MEDVYRVCGQLKARLERAVTTAFRAVEEDVSLRAGVTLTVTVEHDEELNRVQLTYKLKSTLGDVQAREAGHLSHDGQLVLPGYDLAGLMGGSSETTGGR